MNRARLRLSPRAAADLEEIGDYIARDNPSRALTFVDELHTICRGIADNPEICPMRDDLETGVRMAVHKQYLILFRILPTEIRIERVVHGSRDLPRVWQS